MRRQLAVDTPGAPTLPVDDPSRGFNSQLGSSKFPAVYFGSSPYWSRHLWG
jgi:hypothetical protein